MQKAAVFIIFFATSFFHVMATEFEGKIKSIYLHDREVDPYFGILLEGEMSSNPCGNRKDLYVAIPNEVNEMQFSMLLAAKSSGQTVKITNQNATGSKECFGPYSKFNFVQIL